MRFVDWSVGVGGLAEDECGHPDHDAGGDPERHRGDQSAERWAMRMLRALGAPVSLVVDDPVPLDGGTSVRVASSNSSGSPPVSPQTGQLHVVAQAGAEAVSTGMVDLAFQPRTFLMGQ
jgi:hypothetical protein